MDLQKSVRLTVSVDWRLVLAITAPAAITKLLLLIFK